MKKAKKVLSFLLAFAMVFAMNFTTAFAAEAPESSTFPVENTAITSEDEGIMPLMWDQFESDIPAHSYMTFGPITIPDRYMAIEATATVMGGGTNSSSYAVYLQKSGATIAGICKSIDGVTYKNDWIDLRSTNNSYTFYVENGSDVGIHVKVTYYSWQ